MPPKNSRPEHTDAREAMIDESPHHETGVFMDIPSEPPSNIPPDDIQANDAAGLIRRWLASRDSERADHDAAAAAVKGKGAVGPKSFQVDGRRWQVNRIGRLVEVEDVT